MISDSSIEEVKARIDIVDVIGDYVQLKKSGTSYKALSPFTDEKTPSFFVSPSKGIFKCFSSGKGGDAITFLQEYEGMNYLEAIRHLAQKYGVTLEETHSDRADAGKSEREALYIVLGFARDHYRELLHSDQEGRSVGMGYFKERGLNDTTIRTFELGYARDEWDGLMKAATAKGHSEEMLEKAGLIIVKEDGKKYDRFRGRTIFPVHDISGRVIAFGARILKNEKNQPKYINSPETLVYTKSKVLYGLFQAKQEIRKENNVYLVEGYTDVLSLHQAGILNVAASSGTALTEEQIQLLARHTENVTVLFDGDRAGLQASMRGIDMILEKGLNVRVVVCPDGEDPDSYLGKIGSTAFKEFLENERKDFVTFKAAFYAREVGSDPAARADSIREIVTSISRIPDAMKRAIYLKESAGIFNIDESILVAEANKIIIERNRRTQGTRRIEDLPPPPTEEFRQEVVTRDITRIIRDQEIECLRLLINYGLRAQDEFGYYYKYFFSETEDLVFEDHLVSAMVGIYREAVGEGRNPDIDLFLSNSDDRIKSLAADLYFRKYLLSENWHLKYGIVVPEEEDVLDLVFQRNILLLKYRKVTKHLEEEMKKLQQASDPGEEDQIIQDIEVYKRYHRDYANELGIIVDN